MTGERRPIPLLPLESSVNQRFPSGPGAIPKGSTPLARIGISVIDPSGLTRPIWLPASSVNQTAAFAVTTAMGPAFGVGIANSVIDRSGVIRPSLLAAFSTNQTLPSGPGAIPNAEAAALGMGTSAVITPAVVMRPI